MVGFFNQPTPYAGQRYSDLKEQCKTSGHLFVDQEFPTSYKSLFRGGTQKIANVQWKRPGVSMSILVLMFLAIT